jgi:hypothetical protein
LSCGPQDFPAQIVSLTPSFPYGQEFVIYFVSEQHDTRIYFCGIAQL